MPKHAAPKPTQNKDNKSWANYIKNIVGERLENLMFRFVDLCGIWTLLFSKMTWIH
jgi:hypothetical protein